MIFEIGDDCSLFEETKNTNNWSYVCNQIVAIEWCWRWNNMNPVVFRHVWWKLGCCLSHLFEWLLKTHVFKIQFWLYLQTYKFFLSWRKTYYTVVYKSYMIYLIRENIISREKGGTKPTSNKEETRKQGDGDYSFKITTRSPSSNRMSNIICLAENISNWPKRKGK